MRGLSIGVDTGLDPTSTTRRVRGLEGAKRDRRRKRPQEAVLEASTEAFAHRQPEWLRSTVVSHPRIKYAGMTTRWPSINAQLQTYLVSTHPRLPELGGGAPPQRLALSSFLFH